MKIYRMCRIGIALVAMVLAGSVRAAVQDFGHSHYEHLKALEPLFGTWILETGSVKLKFSYKVADGLQKNAILRDVHVENPDGSGEVRVSMVTFYWDPASKQIRSFGVNIAGEVRHGVLTPKGEGKFVHVFEDTQPDGAKEPERREISVKGNEIAVENNQGNSTTLRKAG